MFVSIVKKIEKWRHQVL